MVCCFSCETNRPQPTPKEKRALAEQVFKEALQYGQGTPECMRLIEKATLIDTTYAEAIRELSVAYLKRGMPHKWKPLFDRAVYHDPKTWLMARGVIYLKVYRDYNKAIEDLDAADKLTPDFVDYVAGHSIDFWKGMTYLGLNDYENCIAFYNKHINKETEETGEDWVEIEAFLYRGIAHYESGNALEARKNFEKILFYTQNSADAKYYLSKILKDNGAIDSARTYINQAKEDYQAGYYNQRNYVEALRQIYWDDLVELEKSLDNDSK
ncbi:MAG: hypothetical protein CMH46_05030 [Muricauda sp.]|nr:hypothetical protein [Allomuricauda sp.]|tara:strand:- start:9220 stop:10023 length:804 start_codon:yes stop_codon:yes gene_type:complete